MIDSPDLVQHFKKNINLLLDDQYDCESFFKALAEYNRNRNVQLFVQSISTQVNHPCRVPLYEIVRVLISPKQQLEYDKLCPTRGLLYKATREVHLSPLNLMINSTGGFSTSTGASSVSSCTSSCKTLHEDITARLGFTVCGGKECGTGVYVKTIKRSGTAFRHGLRIGDHVVSVNGVPIDHLTQQEAIHFIGSQREIHMHVRCLGLYPIQNARTGGIQWIRCPPIDMEERQHEAVVYLALDRGVSVGITLAEQVVYFPKANGTDTTRLPRKGLFVVNVEDGGIAAETGLKVGDEIVRLGPMEIGEDNITQALRFARRSTHYLLLTFCRHEPIFSRIAASPCSLRSSKISAENAENVIMQSQEVSDAKQPLQQLSSLSREQPAALENRRTVYELVREYSAAYPPQCAGGSSSCSINPPIGAFAQEKNTQSPKNHRETVMEVVAKDRSLPGNRGQSNYWHMKSSLTAPNQETDGIAEECILFLDSAPQKVGLILEGGSESGHGRCLVASVVPKSPAERGGLCKGDVVLSINEISLTGLKLAEVIRCLAEASTSPLKIIRLTVIKGKDSSLIQRGQVVSSLDLSSVTSTTVQSPTHHEKQVLDELDKILESTRI